jgi:cytochrome c oxidase cbb3-type subunit 3
MDIKRASNGGWRTRWILGLALAAVLAGLYWWSAERSFAAQMLQPEPAVLLQNRALVARAVARAARTYQQHCAACHGANREGNPAHGAPSLADAQWLYGSEQNTIEQIIYYGIRSGHPKARNLTDMPGLGRSGQLTADDVRDVIQYLHSIARLANDQAAAERGRLVFLGKGVCYDCHGADAHGITDYGTPPLDGTAWMYGGDDQTLFNSIYSGRHGLCPAWTNKLTPVQIRSLALYLRETKGKA